MVVTDPTDERIDGVIIANTPADKFVMWQHVHSESRATLGVLVSNTLPYEELREYGLLQVGEFLAVATDWRDIDAFSMVKLEFGCIQKADGFEFDEGFEVVGNLEITLHYASTDAQSPSILGWTKPKSSRGAHRGRNRMDTRKRRSYLHSNLQDLKGMTLPEKEYGDLLNVLTQMNRDLVMPYPEAKGNPLR